MIVIPAIDLIEGKCVRLTRGEKESRKVYDQDAVETAKRYEQAGAKRIHVVDLDAAFEGESKNLATISKIATAVRIPVEVGGGIRSASAVAALVEAGASFVVIGTLVVENPQLAAEIIALYEGKIYVGIDARAGMVATHGWVRTSTRTVEEITERAAEWGARGIIFTAIERDGRLVGPDFEAVTTLAAKSAIPVIASGGVGSLADIRHLAAIPRLEGAIVGKALYEGKVDLAQAMAVQEGIEDPGALG